MQAQIEVTDRQNGADQKNADPDHQDVGVAWRGDEAGEVMGRGGMKRLAQAILRFGKEAEV